LDKLEQAFTYFEDAIKESDEIIADCSPDLQAELIKQKEYFVIALTALEKQVPKSPIIQVTWKACPICNQGIGVNNKTPNPKAIAYCWHCGQKLDWD